MTRDICDWPGCTNEMLCCTGNAGGGRVCRRHFYITNGKAAADMLPHEVEAMLMMADAVKNREARERGAYAVVDAALHAGILVPDAKQVAGYLQEFPVLADQVLGVLPVAKRELGKDAQLSLEMFVSGDSVGDEYLTLKVRQDVYDVRLMNIIHAFSKKHLHPLPDCPGWFQVTSDFQKPL